MATAHTISPLVGQASLNLPPQIINAAHTVSKKQQPKPNRKPPSRPSEKVALKVTELFEEKYDRTLSENLVKIAPIAYTKSKEKPDEQGQSDEISLLNEGPPEISVKSLSTIILDKLVGFISHNEPSPETLTRSGPPPEVRTAPPRPPDIKQEEKGTASSHDKVSNKPVKLWAPLGGPQKAAPEKEPERDCNKELDETIEALQRMFKNKYDSLNKTNTLQPLPKSLHNPFNEQIILGELENKHMYDKTYTVLLDSKRSQHTTGHFKTSIDQSVLAITTYMGKKLSEFSEMSLRHTILEIDVKKEEVCDQITKWGNYTKDLYEFISSLSVDPFQIKPNLSISDVLKNLKVNDITIDVNSEELHIFLIDYVMFLIALKYSLLQTVFKSISENYSKNLIAIDELNTKSPENYIQRTIRLSEQIFLYNVYNNFIASVKEEFTNYVKFDVPNIAKHIVTMAKIKPILIDHEMMIRYALSMFTKNTRNELVKNLELTGQFIEESEDVSEEADEEADEEDEDNGSRFIDLSTRKDSSPAKQEEVKEEPQNEEADEENEESDEEADLEGIDVDDEEDVDEEEEDEPKEEVGGDGKFQQNTVLSRWFYGLFIVFIIILITITLVSTVRQIYTQIAFATKKKDYIQYQPDYIG